MSISAEVLNSFRPADENRIDKLLRAEIDADSRKIVVLDDDPTGVQTIHDLAVYTRWDRESILDGFRGRTKCFSS